jgi:hypothetical protein
MLLSTCENPENRREEDRTSAMGESKGAPNGGWGGGGCRVAAPLQTSKTEI